MAGHRDQRAFQTPCHVLHEACLAAAGRAFEQHRQLVPVGRFEYCDFLAYRFVVGLIADKVLFWCQGVRFHRGLA